VYDGWLTGRCRAALHQDRSESLPLPLLLLAFPKRNPGLDPQQLMGALTLSYLSAAEVVRNKFNVMGAFSGAFSN
jgi:hypothetical protein